MHIKSIHYIMISMVMLWGCSDTEIESSTYRGRDSSTHASVEVGSSNASAYVIEAYTSDANALWLDANWASVTKEKMKKLAATMQAPSRRLSTVLLFDSKDHMPNVESTGMDYPQRYDKWLVAGYWRYSPGKTKFCWGGQKEDGNFRNCEH